MSTKTISIKTEAYERLKLRKLPRESFSDVINRLTGKKSLLEFAGMLSKKEADYLEKSVHESRKKWSERAAKIADELK